MEIMKFKFLFHWAFALSLSLLFSATCVAQEVDTDTEEDSSVFKKLSEMNLNLFKDISASQTEISTTADAWILSPPDSVRITFLLESTGKSATATFNNVKTTFEAVKKAIASPGSIPLNILDRGIQLSSAARKSPSINSGELMRAEQFIAVESTDLTAVSTLIDSALGAGASSVVDVSYFVHKDEANITEAISVATNKARQKAELIASSLGVSLGKLLSATATEESLGRTQRIQQKDGIALKTYADKELHVYVTVRYAVGN